MGSYDEAQRIPVKTMRVAADVPPAERTRLEVIRTDTSTFQRLMEARRDRRENWFHFQAGKIDVCNVPIPVRGGITPK
jgi:peptidylprolyl isomerase